MIDCIFFSAYFMFFPLIQVRESWLFLPSRGRYSLDLNQSAAELQLIYFLVTSLSEKKVSVSVVLSFLMFNW